MPSQKPSDRHGSRLGAGRMATALFGSGTFWALSRCPQRPPALPQQNERRCFRALRRPPPPSPAPARRTCCSFQVRFLKAPATLHPPSASSSKGDLSFPLLQGLGADEERGGLVQAKLRAAGSAAEGRLPRP